MYTGRRTSTGITLAGADTGRVWVRADENSREETQVWGSASRINLPVWVGPNVAGELEIKTLEQTEAALVAGAGAAASLLPPITPDNNDQIVIGGRQFQPGRMGMSHLGGLYVYVAPFHYDGGWWPGGDVLLTPPATASTKAWCALAFDPATATFTQFTGTEYALPILMTETELGAIAVTDGYIPVGAVVLQNGQTVIDGSEVWADFHYHFGQASGSGGTYYQTIRDNGTPLTQRAAINFHAGSNVTITIADDSGNDETDVTIAASGGGGTDAYGTCNGRLTLTTGVPVTTSDVTAAATLYFTPYKGNQIGIYDGSSAWSMFTFSEISLSLSGYTASKPYDIWAYVSGGSVTLDSTVWTNDTTRATALALQDGIYIKSGDTTRRYLGTIYITSAGGVTEDSAAKRYVWNYYNRANRSLVRMETAGSWNYSTTSLQQANNNAANQVNVVVGVTESAIHLSVSVIAQSSGAAQSRRLAFGLDSTTTQIPDAQAATAYTAAADFQQLTAMYNGMPPVGHHYYAWLERGAGSGTQTWYGSDGSYVNGITGWIDS